MYNNLSNRLRGEAEVSDASPYIKELMRQAADALDHFEKGFERLSSAPTIIPAEPEEEGET